MLGLVLGLVWKGTNHAVFNLVGAGGGTAQPGSLHSFVGLVFPHCYSVDWTQHNSLWDHADWSTTPPQELNQVSSN